MNKIDYRELIRFLSKIWSYRSDLADTFTIVAIDENKKIIFKHFSLSELKSYDKLFNSVLEFLIELEKKKCDIYFQVLPLAKKPEKGRGTAQDVKIGSWLWCDLDYKTEVNEKVEIGIIEKDDYALSGYYSEGEKIIKIERPPLSKVLSEVKEKLNLEPSIVVDSGAGYHLYFQLREEIESEKLKQIEEKIVDILGGDKKSRDLARILRLAGTINTRVGRRAKVIYENDSAIYSFEEIENAIKQYEQKSLKTKIEKKDELNKKEFKNLSDYEIIQIIDVLSDVYKVGYRQKIILYLSGWLTKAKVHPISIFKIVKSIIEKTNDEEEKMRYGAVVYTLKKYGIDIKPFENEIINLIGMRPYGLEAVIREEEIKGKSGLQEVFEEILKNEEDAITKIYKLQEILGTFSPYKDVRVELINYEKNIFIVANLRKKILVRAYRNSEGKLVYKEKIVDAVPVEVEIFVSPLGEVTKYAITFEGNFPRKILKIGPAYLEEIADRLVFEGIVYHRRLLNDSLSAIVQAYFKHGDAIIREELDRKGFYYVNDKIIAVDYNIKPIDYEKLKNALLLLNEISKWYNVDKFSTIIKWSIIAPFSLIIKSNMKRFIPALFLTGASKTGKTTLGEICLSIWGLGSNHIIGGGHLDTEARLGKIFSDSTFFFLVNEPQNAFKKEEIRELIKNGIENPKVRGKYIKGTYVEIPSLANFIFTSNYPPFSDDALMRRLKIIYFTYSEKIDNVREKEFNEKIKGKINILNEIGNYVANLISQNPNLLFQFSEWEDLGTQILAKAYVDVGLEIPEWIYKSYGEIINFEAEIMVETIERIKRVVNDLFTKYVSKFMPTEEGTQKINIDDIPFSNRFEKLAENYLIPGAIKDKNKIYITYEFLRLIEVDEKVNLKDFSDLFGFEYSQKKISGKNFKVAIGDFDKFINIIEKYIHEG